MHEWVWIREHTLSLIYCWFFRGNTPNSPITTEALISPGGAFLFISPLKENLKTASTIFPPWGHCIFQYPASPRTVLASEKAAGSKPSIMAKKCLICLIIRVKIQREFFIFKAPYQSYLINPHNISDAWIFFNYFYSRWSFSWWLKFKSRPLDRER